MPPPIANMAMLREFFTLASKHQATALSTDAAPKAKVPKRVCARPRS